MRRAAAALALLLPVSLVSACEQEPEDQDVVAFLVADAGPERWREQDLPAFADAVEEACPGCVPLTRDAGGDAAAQRRQLRDVVEAGADVVVLNAVSAESGEELVAGSRVPVVAYDRLVPGADHLVGVDQRRSGREAARTLRSLLPRGPAPVLVVSDGPGGWTDRVLSALGSRVRVRESLGPDQQDRAQAWVAARAGGTDPVAAVLTPEDELAAAVSAGLGQAGLAVGRRPLVIGHDGGLPAVRRLVRGTQALTVHASRPDQAAVAADLAVRIARGQRAPRHDRVVEGVPAHLVDPTVVTLPTLTNTVVRRGVYSTEEICAGRLLTRCERLGIR